MQKNDRPESAIQRDIIKYLRGIPGFKGFVVHGGPMQEAGQPDIIGCLRGRWVGFEVKKPVGSYGATKLQLATIEAYRRCGGICAIVTSVDDVRQILSEYIDVPERKL